MNDDVPGQISPEDLMRYLDGELPPGERQHLEAALAASTELQRELALYQGLKRGLQDLSFAPPPSGTSVWDAVGRRLARPAGWVLLLAGAAVWAGYGAYVFATSPTDLVQKLAVGAVVIGVLLLLASVIWEQYRAWLVDPYRHVHR